MSRLKHHFFGATVDASPSPACPELRPYQAAAVAAVRERFAAGDRATLVVLPTGTGKTVVFAEVARRVVAKGRRALVLAHRRELLDQAIGKLAATGVRAELEQGPARAGDGPVVVASVATLRGARLASWRPDAFALVIVDEAHHATAASYGAILDHFAPARVLGVTATPDRADGAGLGAVFASVAYRYDVEAAIRDGWLAPIRGRRINLEGVDLDAVRTVAGDLDRTELATVMAAPAVVAASAAAIVAEAGARPCVAFTVDVTHAEALAAAINALRPGAARAVSGRSSADDRAGAAADLAAGRVQIVCNAALWVEGFDCPTVAAVAIARPTKSRGLFAQMVGRGTRLAPGKVDCLVIDLAGVTRRHRLATAADVLAGDLPADVAALVLATTAAPGGADILEALADARRRLDPATPEAALRWLAEDVADLLQVEIAPGAGGDGGSATPAQRRALDAWGLDDIPPALTRGQASRILDVLERRRVARLASWRMVRLLRRFGVTGAASLTFDAARVQIDHLLKRCR